jgi:hypothetical protein
MSVLLTTLPTPERRREIMNQLRRLIIALAAIGVLALVAFALVNRPAVPVSDDDIIIKGGSLEIQCGKNHGNDCLGVSDNKGKYKHKKGTGHITNIVVRDIADPTKVFLDRSFDQMKQPQIEITYKEQIGL